MRKTKVFISCGQRDNTNESEIAKKVAALLERKEYEPYVAKSIQSLGALTEEIYRQLDDSEYFLFIDFKREKICSETGGVQFRGSLFSHQELGIASYLEKNCLVFQEKDLRLEGIQSFIISNPHVFTSTKELLAKIETEVTTKWQTGWKNELKISMATPVYQDAVMTGGQANGQNSRWYHVSVRNNHYCNHAKNCYAYILDVACGLAMNIIQRDIETHWSGYEMPATTILPGDTRDIDVFFYFQSWGEPLFYFNPFTTSGHYHPIPIQNNSNIDGYIFTVKVISDNFRPVLGKFKLKFHDDINNIEFSQIN